MPTGVVLLAAGAGRRLGAGKPKQFLSLGGEPLFMTPLRTFAATRSVKEIVVVCAPQRRALINRHVRKIRTKISITTVAGGALRGQSVRNGVKALSKSVDVVLVHDSARPLVTRDIIERVETAARDTGVALAAWPLADTLKVTRRTSGRRSSVRRLVKKTIPRTDLWLAQTPQGFRRDVARKCLLNPSASATDDVELAQRKGFKVAIVDGSATNFKVTYPLDLKLCRLLR